jgi:hypothetical protein
MSDFEPRRCQQQSRALFSAAIACLLLCACDDGRGRPIEFLPDGSVDGGGGNALESAGRSGSLRDANVDDEATETLECEHTEHTWPAAYATDEMKLLEQINLLRTTNGMCTHPFGATPLALESDANLRCSARLGVPKDPRGPGGGRPTFELAWNVEPEQKPAEPGGIRDRGRRAAVKDAKVLAEIVVRGVSSVNGIMDFLREDPDFAAGLCSLVTYPPFSIVGVARSGNVWVLDFAVRIGSGPPHPTSSGTGNSGPGTSGTGGR